MKIEVVFDTDPQEQNVLICHKLFQVFFIEPRDSPANVVSYTSAVITRAAGDFLWPALTLDMKVKTPHQLSEKAIHPKISSKSSDFFSGDTELRIWWGRDSEIVNSRSSLESAFNLINNTTASQPFGPSEKEILRAVQQVADAKGVNLFTISEPDSTKRIQPFLLLPGTPEISIKESRVLFRTDPPSISEHLNKLHRSQAIEHLGVGYWVRQNFLLPSGHRTFSEIELDIRWPPQIACRDFTMYFVLNANDDVIDKVFRFSILGDDDYIIDVLEKNPPQLLDHFLEWKQLGITYAKLLRFPSSKVDAHFRDRTARRVQVSFKLKSQAETNRRQMMLIILNVWFASIFALGMDTTRQRHVGELYPTLSWGDWFITTPTFWWFLTILSLVPAVALRYQRRTNLWATAAFWSQVTIFSIWSFLQWLIRPYDLPAGSHPIDGILSIVTPVALFCVISLGVMITGYLFWPYAGERVERIKGRVRRLFQE
jgi:hypothetical protein